MKILDSIPAIRASTLIRTGSYLVAILLFCSNYWINRYFGTPDIDQISYHLQFGAQGLEASDPAILRRFIRWCVLAPLLLFAAVLAIERWIIPCRHRLTRFVHTILPAAALLAATASGPINCR